MEIILHHDAVAGTQNKAPRKQYNVRMFLDSQFDMSKCDFQRGFDDKLDITFPFEELNDFLNRTESTVNDKESYVADSIRLHLILYTKDANDNQMLLLRDVDRKKPDLILMYYSVLFNEIEKAYIRQIIEKLFRDR